MSTMDQLALILCIFVVACFGLTYAAEYGDQTTPMVAVQPNLSAIRNPEQDDDDVLKKIKEEQLPWEPQKNKFYKKSHSEKRKILGFKQSKLQNLNKEAILLGSGQGQSSSVTFTDIFDARIQWPFCNFTISDVRDQGDCGSCWAHGVAEMASDRICISSGGATHFKISTQDQITCMPSSLIPTVWLPWNDLCQGFDSLIAARMYVGQGIVSGGEQDQPTTGCMPYSQLAWLNGTGDIRTCTSTCSDTSYPTTYPADKHFGKNVLLMGNSLASDKLSVNVSYNIDAATGNVLSHNSVVDTVENLIKRELTTNGPVTASFNVFNDFMLYSTGVYRKSSTAQLLGGHVVKIIGWGVTNTGLNYWICVNSWTTSWGENGFFRILRGTNEVGIEDYIVAVSVA